MNSIGVYYTGAENISRFRLFSPIPFRRVSHSVKSALKGLEIIDIFKSFLVRRHKTMTAENQNPTKANLFILSRFNSIEECTYRSSVMVVLACPRISLKDLISKPTSTHRVAKVCLSVWK